MGHPCAVEALELDKSRETPLEAPDSRFAQLRLALPRALLPLWPLTTGPLSITLPASTSPYKYAAHPSPSGPDHPPSAPLAESRPPNSSRYRPASGPGISPPALSSH